MPRHNIPVYAIVELLMLMAQHDKNIGDYRGHTIRNHSILVKTSTGNITFSEDLVMKQFSEPDKVTRKELAELFSFFRPTRLRQRSA